MKNLYNIFICGLLVCIWPHAAYWFMGLAALCVLSDVPARRAAQAKEREKSEAAANKERRAQELHDNKLLKTGAGNPEADKMYAEFVANKKKHPKGKLFFLH